MNFMWLQVACFDFSYFGKLFTGNMGGSWFELSVRSSGTDAQATVQPHEPGARHLTYTTIKFRSGAIPSQQRWTIAQPRQPAQNDLI